MTFTIIKEEQKISTDTKMMLFKKHLQFNYMSQSHSKDSIKLQEYMNTFQKIKPIVTSNNLQKALKKTFQTRKPNTNKITTSIPSRQIISVF